MRLHLTWLCSCIPSTPPHMFRTSKAAGDPSYDHESRKSRPTKWFHSVVSVFGDLNWWTAIKTWDTLCYVNCKLMIRILFMNFNFEAIVKKQTILLLLKCAGGRLVSVELAEFVKRAPSCLLSDNTHRFAKLASNPLSPDRWSVLLTTVPYDNQWPQAIMNRRQHQSCRPSHATITWVEATAPLNACSWWRLSLGIEMVRCSWAAVS